MDISDVEQLIPNKQYTTNALIKKGKLDTESIKISEHKNSYKINDIITYRIPPIIWNIFNYTLYGYASFFKKKYLIYFMTLFIIIYYILNKVFDLYTFQIELNNDDFNLEKKNINDITLYEKILYNNFKFKITEITQEYDFICDVNFYQGKNKYIEYLLNVIYLIGFTDKLYCKKEKFTNYKKFKNIFI